jgi:hypothetical protein
MALQPLWILATFEFLNPDAGGRTPWMVYQPVARPLFKHMTAQTQNRRAQTSMSRVGFEPMIPAFEEEKTVQYLDCAPIAVGITVDYYKQISTNLQVQPVPELQIRCAGCS